MSEPDSIKASFEKLIRSRKFKFPELRGSLDATNKRGVYVIYKPQGKKALHVGSTPSANGGIAQRLRNHMGGKSSFVRKTLDSDGSKLRGTHYYQYIEVADARQRALLEAYAIGRLCPEHIGSGKDTSSE